MTKYQGRGAGRGVYGPGGKGRGKGKELSQYFRDSGASWIPYGPDGYKTPLPKVAGTIFFFELIYHQSLGGGFKHFLFSSIFGEDFHFD